MANRRFTAEEARERKNQRQREYAKRTGYEADMKYKKNNTKQIALRLNYNTDADILAKFESVENTQGYIKDLIRADIAHRKAAKLSRRIADLIGLKEKVYVWFESDDICKKFQQDAEAEGFTFGDGMKPTEKEIADVYAILEDKELCYVGHIGHIAFDSGAENVLRVDYKKFVNGENFIV